MHDARRLLGVNRGKHVLSGEHQDRDIEADVLTERIDHADEHAIFELHRANREVASTGFFGSNRLMSSAFTYLHRAAVGRDGWHDWTRR